MLAIKCTSENQTNGIIETIPGKKESVSQVKAWDFTMTQIRVIVMGGQTQVWQTIRNRHKRTVRKNQQTCNKDSHLEQDFWDSTAPRLVVD